MDVVPPSADASDRVTPVVVAITPGTDSRVASALTSRWGPTVVSRGQVHEHAALPTYVAWIDEDLVGAATWHVDPSGDVEVVTIDAFRLGVGAGGALLDAVVHRARELGAARVWLITTNDNTHALRFYQRHGFDLVRLHHDAIAASRRLKPSIPDRGADGIPLRHELELQLVLRDGPVP